VIIFLEFFNFGFRGQALCTTAAVVGGKSLASQISEKMVIFRNCVKITNLFVLYAKSNGG
jgi:putative Ca2+/H+ antiporter (TMEM165/GDT1 family)